MPYTVKQLAKLSGVSVRTLHFYDEIELLKPAYYGENNYRYYEEAQLFILQQILFFRELGFQLSDIRRIISSPDFDKITTLESHREILNQKLHQMQKLIATVDKTIAHLRGKTMKLEEIFHGFNADKQTLYENYLIENGVNDEVIRTSKEKIKNWQEADWMKVKQEGDAIHEGLVLAIKNNLQPSSQEVQKLISRHYELTKSFWTPTKETYIGLSQLYCSHPDFVNFYAGFHPQLLAFLIAGMKLFAERELS